MPQYRIPFHGTLLVEAATLSDAEVSAGAWVQSMKQATHGVEIEHPTTGEIRALSLWIHQQPTDITTSFATYLAEPHAHRTDEGYRPNYHIGLQCDWELFEFGRRAGEEEGCSIMKTSKKS